MEYNTYQNAFLSSSRNIIDGYKKFKIKHTPYNMKRDFQCVSQLPFLDENKKNLIRLQRKMNLAKSMNQSNEDRYMNYMKKYYVESNLASSRSVNNINKIDIENMQECTTFQHQPRCSEISNPTSCSKIENRDYQSLKKKEKEFFDFNYRLMQRQNRRNVDIKPYNSHNLSFLYQPTYLKHNVILNPVNDYGYNKYFVNSSFQSYYN